MAITKRRQIKYATKASVQHENKLKKCKTQRGKMREKNNLHPIYTIYGKGKMGNGKWEMSEREVG